MNDRVKTILGLAIISILVLTIITFVWIFFVRNAVVDYNSPPQVFFPDQDKGRACTEEAKLCPDGSAVGRTGPNCEFAPCPGENSDISTWQTYRNDKYGLELKYPVDKFSDPISFRNSGNPVAISSYDLKISEIGILQSGMEFNISIYSGNSSVNDAYKNGTSIVDYVSSTKENIKFNGLEAVRYSGSSRGDMINGLIIQKNDLAVSLYMRYAPNSKNAAEIFNQIVSTFKFTE